MKTANGNDKSMLGWGMFDFVNSVYTTLVVTFIYGTCLVKVIAPDYVMATHAQGVAYGHLQKVTLAPPLLQIRL